MLPPDAAEGGKDRLHYRLFVDGAEKWSLTISTPSVSNEKQGGSFWDIFKTS